MEKTGCGCLSSALFPCARRPRPTYLSHNSYLMPGEAALPLGMGGRASVSLARRAPLRGGPLWVSGRPTAERHRDVSGRFLLWLFITPENAGSSRDLSQMSSDEELMEPRGNRSDLRRNARCLLCSHRRLGHIFCRPARNDRLICVQRAETAAETQLAHVSPRIRRVALLSYLWPGRTSRRTTVCRPASASASPSALGSLVTETSRGEPSPIIMPTRRNQEVRHQSEESARSRETPARTPPSGFHYTDLIFAPVTLHPS